MKFTWNWLKEFVEIDASPEEVGERLTMAGLEVDGIESTGRVAGVVCGEIISVRPHPGADRLRICEVNAGAGELATVVCGAPNVAVGQRVPFAVPGAVLPSGMEIRAAEIRGVASAGMLCSAVEIGAGEDASGLLLLPDSSAPGADVAELLGLADIILELSITPNRGDCLSVLGIAREVAALTGSKLRDVSASTSRRVETNEAEVAITIDDPERCRRYVGRTVRGISLASSPAWMQARLRAVGVRPINNVVDITNYVLMERGQPLHAFDLDRLPRPEIRVGAVAGATRFETLDGQQRDLVADDLAIFSGGQVVALAGVMGGASSEVVEGTKNVFLEAAWFQPESIRRTSKRLGLRSESSYRFERGIDLEGVLPASERAAELLASIAGAEPLEMPRDVYPLPRRNEPIVVRRSRVEGLLGVGISTEELRSRLAAFSMPTAASSEDSVSVDVPSYRTDVTREIDVIEEVARSIGYDRIEATLPESRMVGGELGAVGHRIRELRRLLAAHGLVEVVSLGFASPEQNRAFRGLVPDRTPVRVLNPITRDDSEMRLSLVSGLLHAAAYNFAQGQATFAGFSLGKAHHDAQGTYRENLTIAGVVCPHIEEEGVAGRRVPWDFADAKGLAESVLERFRIVDARWQRTSADGSYHPGKTATIHVGEEIVGVVGCLHPDVAEDLSLVDPVWVFELDLQKLLDYRPRPVVCEELPRFPVVVRDLALVAEDSFESDRVVRFVREWQGARGLVEAVKLFDQYAGAPIPEGMKSLTFTISYRSAEKTLTDAEVNEVHGRLVGELKAALNVELR